MENKGKGLRNELLAKRFEKSWPFYFGVRSLRFHFAAQFNRSGPIIGNPASKHLNNLPKISKVQLKLASVFNGNTSTDAVGQPG